MKLGTVVFFTLMLFVLPPGCGNDAERVGLKHSGVVNMLRLLERLADGK